MNTFHKREINPKTAFFILSLSGFLLLSLSIPLLSKWLLNEGKDAGIIFSDSLIVWGFFGLIAGTGFAVSALKNFRRTPDKTYTLFINSNIITNFFGVYFNQSS